MNRLSHAISCFVFLSTVAICDGIGLAQTTTTWLGGTGNWNDVTKWSPNCMPNNTSTSQYNVAINALTGTPYTVTADFPQSFESQSIALNSLLVDSSEATVRFDIYRSTINSIIVNSGTLDIKGNLKNTVISGGGGNIGLSEGTFENVTFQRPVTLSGNSSFASSTNQSVLTLMGVSGGFGQTSKNSGTMILDNSQMSFTPDSTYSNIGTIQVTNGSEVYWNAQVYHINYLQGMLQGRVSFSQSKLSLSRDFWTDNSDNILVIDDPSMSFSSVGMLKNGTITSAGSSPIEFEGAVRNALIDADVKVNGPVSAFSDVEAGAIVPHRLRLEDCTLNKKIDVTAQGILEMVRPKGTGTVTANGGRVAIEGLSSFGGQITATNATVAFTGTTVTPVSTLSSLTADNCLISIECPLDNNGNTLHVTSSQRFSVAGGKILGGNIVSGDGSVLQIHGGLNSIENASVSSDIEIYGAGQNETTRLTLRNANLNGSTVRFQGSAGLYNEVEIPLGDRLTGNVDLGTKGRLILRENSSIGAGVTISGGGSIIGNNEIGNPVHCTNNGQILCNTRGITVESVSNDGSISIAAGGVLRAEGLTNDTGTINIDSGGCLWGDLPWAPTCTLLPDATLTLELGASEFNHNNIPVRSFGVVELGGELEISFADDFVPQAGQRFILVSAEPYYFPFDDDYTPSDPCARHGMFSQISAELPEGLYPVVSYDFEGVYLDIVPEPASLGMIGVGVLALLRLKNRH